ncbi:unnamed protein product [Brassicogethes aeneus]|uniref:MADF domain-containing protein n=1 Tax=Brassicogethes aeneus TaxID=1431903 RepID=A0A9P0AX53_BRAAE|nr:unnamed protein product [Brassicogethes aeneus]
MIAIRLVRSKLRKREEHSNSVHPSDVVLQTAPANPVVTKATAPQNLQPDPLAYRGQILWQYPPPPVPQHHFLYNNDQENCWASVANSLCSTASEVKARFKSLREKYRREVQIREKLERSGAAASTRPVWPLMSFFKFMYKCGEESQRQTTSNISLQDTTTTLQASESYYHLTDSDEEENIVVQVVDENNAVESNSNTNNENLNVPKAKKRKGRSVAETTNLKSEIKQIDNVLVDVSAAINNLNTNKKENTDDRYELFSRYMASELKNIGEPHASIVMEELQVTIINYKRELRSDI